MREVKPLVLVFLASAIGCWLFTGPSTQVRPGVKHGAFKRSESYRHAQYIEARRREQAAGLVNFGEPYSLYLKDAWSVKLRAKGPDSEPTYELTSVAPKIRIQLMMFGAKSELDAYEALQGERLQAVYSPKLPIEKLQWNDDTAGFLWIARNSGIAYFPVENQWFRAFFTQDDDDKVSGLEQVVAVLKSLRRVGYGDCSPCAL